MRFWQSPPTEHIDRDIAIERRRRAEVYRWAYDDEERQARLYAKCKSDPIFWFHNFAWMHDARLATVETHGTSRIPLLTWDYAVDYVKLFLGLDGERTADGDLWRVIVPKSRAMGGTKLACLASIWGWQFDLFSSYGFMSRIEKSVDNGKTTGEGSIFSFLRWAIRQQPSWMMPPPFRLAKVRGSQYDCNLSLFNPVTGNLISGAATTGSSFRGDRTRRLVVDEANSIDALESVLGSVGAVGPPWLLSSVYGRYTYFARLRHGDTGAEIHDYGRHKGHRGWCQLRLHYSLRPDRRPGTVDGDTWLKIERANADSPMHFASEYEIDDAAAVHGRIFADEFDDRFHILSRRFWVDELMPQLPGARIIEAWDFGYSVSLTSVVWAAVIDGCVYVLDYRHWADAEIGTVIHGIGEAGYYTAASQAGVMPSQRLGDIHDGTAPKMVGGQRQQTVSSWRQNLREHGVYVNGVQIEVERSIHRTRTLLSQDRLFFCPPTQRIHGGLPSLVDCVRQYHRKLSSSGDSPETYTRGYTPPPEKDVYSHTADALQHIVHAVWHDIEPTLSA